MKSLLQAVLCWELVVGGWWFSFFYIHDNILDLNFFFFPVEDSGHFFSTEILTSKLFSASFIFHYKRKQRWAIQGTFFQLMTLVFVYIKSRQNDQKRNIHSTILAKKTKQIKWSTTGDAWRDTATVNTLQQTADSSNFFLAKDHQGKH